MRKVIIAVMLFAAVCMANQMQRDMLLFARYTQRGSPSVPTDYWHYWHPSFYGDGLDRGNATTLLHATNITGTVTISDRGWTFPSGGGANGITLGGGIDQGDSFSLSVWTANPFWSTQGGLIISDRLTTATADSDFQYSFVSGSLWRGIVWSGSTDYSYDTAQRSDNWWHHVYMAGNGQQKTYINGVLVATNAYAGTINNVSTNAVIGNIAGTEIDSGFSYRGDLDKMLLFRRMLTEDEVLALYFHTRIPAASDTKALARQSTPPINYIHYYHPGKTGNSLDLSDNQNHGTNVNVTVSTNGWFFSSDSPTTARYVDLEKRLWNNQNYTISAWVQPDFARLALQSTLGGNLFSDWGGTSQREFALRLCTPNTNSVTMVVQDTGNATTSFIATNIAWSAWTHLAVSVKDTPSGPYTVTIYINGSEVFQGDSADNKTPREGNPGTTSFGGLQKTFEPQNRNYRGYADNIKIYDYVLTDAQIEALYNQGREN